MKRPTNNPRYSPSCVHRAWMDRNALSEGYSGVEPVAAWQRRLRRKLRHRLGKLPSMRAALRPKTLWKRDISLGTIEKVVFTAEQEVDVPAYVCLPAKREPPFPFMICLQGHTSGMHQSIGVDRADETKSIDVVGDRDFGLQCLRHGIAALCIEQRSLGERGEKRQQSVSKEGCHDAALHALMLGRTLIGERVYDVDRGIDYLAQRGDADLRRIGVMGNSGGGTISLFAAALLPRIAVAMPSCYFCTFRASIMSMYHCSCNYVPGLLELAEMSDIMGLFAPKPVVLVAGKEDPLFPISATRRAFRDLKKIYRACDAGDRCHLIVGEGGHRFYADAAWPVLPREWERRA